jgi:hypothetical protein
MRIVNIQPAALTISPAAIRRSRHSRRIEPIALARRVDGLD